MSGVIEGRGAELANALTHGAGALASLAGGAGLVVYAALSGDAWRFAGALVFSVSLLTLYSASTLYHAARNPIARARLKVFDHCAIFLLIAGTYTPFTLGPLRGPWGWSILGTVWGLAAAGIVFKLFFTGRLRLLSTAMYLGMGWLVLVVARPLAAALPTGPLVWLAAGGIAYTGGTFFYHSRRIPYAHAIWHLFVLAGSTCHFVAVATGSVAA